jgi:hypothetical protein
MLAWTRQYATSAAPAQASTIAAAAQPKRSIVLTAMAIFSGVNCEPN